MKRTVEFSVREHPRQAPHEPGKNPDHPNKPGKRTHYSDQYSSDGDYDVPDPWYGRLDGFYDTLTVVETGATGIVNHLRRRCLCDFMRCHPGIGTRFLGFRSNLLVFSAMRWRQIPSGHS
ncbi:low molecular weight phosphatase family protein [Mobiluncus mulieris]|uniref:hypothetical protein n=1 Tax=Mobiluncus mulieris TaxID=2052 RepID=UPI002015F51A|nr:hypothetical protein [Mobiluncus mulieris]